jgi:hypothetical protein
MWRVLDIASEEEPQSKQTVSARAKETEENDCEKQYQ